MCWGSFFLGAGSVALLLVLSVGVLWAVSPTGYDADATALDLKDWPL